MNSITVPTAVHLRKNNSLEDKKPKKSKKFSQKRKIDSID